MKNTNIISMYQRAFAPLIKEVELYPNDSSLWEVIPGINNSAGNLCLHIEGSLSYFIGNLLGKSGYIRKRDEEFTLKGLTKNETIARLNQTLSMVEKVMNQLTDEELSAEFPMDFAGKETAEFYILFFCGHVQYHLGQIGYLRRMLAHS